MLSEFINFHFGLTKHFIRRTVYQFLKFSNKKLPDIPLKQNGYIIIDNFINEKICDKIINDFEKFIKKNDRNFYADNEKSDIRIFGAEKISNEIKEFFESAKIKKILEDTFKVEIEGICTLMNKLIPKSSNLGSGGGWHRDSHIFQCKAFLFLNDVSKKNGPLCIIKGSQNYKYKLNEIFERKKISTLRIEDREINKESESIVFEVKKGSLILADTSTIHRGLPIEEYTRYCLTNYYTYKRFGHLNKYKKNMINVD